jgi:predicted SprT family Zn-dependent metalloprotease
VGRALFIVEWPAIPVRWNKRLRRAGRAVIDTRRGRFVAARIELSPTYFEVYPADLGGILVHEAVHVGLAIQGRPFGHGSEFRRACDAAGGLLHSRWLPGRVFRYQCPICEMVLERRRRASDSRWCAECVGGAEEAGLEPYAAQRAMRLIETVYCGPEEQAPPAPTPFEHAVECGPKEAPVRYPVGGVGEPDSDSGVS